MSCTGLRMDETRPTAPRNRVTLAEVANVASAGSSETGADATSGRSTRPGSSTRHQPAQCDLAKWIRVRACGAYRYV